MLSNFGTLPVLAVFFGLFFIDASKFDFYEKQLYQKEQRIGWTLLGPTMQSICQKDNNCLKLQILE
jgi:hypothetical protein